mgnify:CR=1 FL=1
MPQGVCGVVELDDDRLVVALARTETSPFLSAALAETPLRLASLQGGNKHNAIPREAAATVVLPTEARESLTRIVEREAAAIREEGYTVTA